MGIEDLAEGLVWRAGADAAVSGACRVTGVALGGSHWALLCKAPGEIVLATNLSMDFTLAMLQAQK